MAFGPRWQRVWAAAIENSFLDFPEGLGVLQVTMRGLTYLGYSEGQEAPSVVPYEAPPSSDTKAPEIDSPTCLVSDE